MLKDLSVADLSALVKDLKKPFQSRDIIWANRRRVRFRQMDSELETLPLSNKAKKPLMIYQTELPNQEVHKRVKRLISNLPRIDVVPYDDSPSAKRRAQDLQDGLRALWRTLTRRAPSPEELAIQYQQGDGVGLLKLEFLPHYILNALKPYDPDALLEGTSEASEKYRRRVEELRAQGKEEPEARAYDELTEEEKRRVPVPFRLVAVDPLACYWREDDECGIELIVETGKRQLHPLLTAINDTSYTVSVSDGRFIVHGDDVMLGPTMPKSIDPRTEIEYCEIRTKDEIAIVLRHPSVTNRSIVNGTLKEGDAIALVYDNPFRPYSTGYFLLPGDVTSSADPAHRYQPPILGVLNTAQADNVLTTIRLSAAIEAALRDRYIKSPDAAPPPPLTQADSDKTPETRDGVEIPQIPGDLKVAEAPNIDLDKADAKLVSTTAQFVFPEVLAGDATSADSGHKLAIQVSQADTQIVPYQNRRATMIAAVLQSCVQAVKYLDTTVYVKSAEEGKIRKLDPADMDIDYDIIVTVGSETPVTKFAKWAALQQRYERGTLSWETLMEASDVENPEQEMARIFEGQTLVAAMQQVIPMVVKAVMERVQARLAPPQPPVGGGLPPESGLAGGGGLNPDSAQIAMVGRLPGVGMSPGGPTTGEFGPRVQGGGGDLEGRVVS